MRLTARKLVISLLILAQGIIPWQAAFSVGLIQLNAVDTKNPVCHQAQINATHADMQCCCCEHNCVDFDTCSDCAHSSIGLISSSQTINFSQWLLNSTVFFTFLDWQPVLLLKPPRQNSSIS